MKLFTRTKKVSKKVVAEKMNDAKNSFLYTVGIAFTVLMLFLSTSVNAQSTFEEFQTDVNMNSDRLVGIDLGGFNFTKIEVTNDRVFYMEMQFTNPMFNDATTATIPPKNKKAMRDQFVRSLAGQPKVKAQMEQFGIKVRIVLKTYEGTVFLDETVTASDVPTVTYN